MDSLNPWTIQIAIPRPLSQTFTYAISEDQKLLFNSWKGLWCRVPFGKAQVLAWVWGEPVRFSELSNEQIPSKFPKPSQLKGILEIGPEEERLSAELLKCIEFLHQYYHAPFGEVLQAVVSPATLSVKKGPRQKKKWMPALDGGLLDPVVLTQEQAQIVSDIRPKLLVREFSPHLLAGVTGSGKTEVYLELAREALAQGRSVLLMVPEIALSQHLHDRVEKSLGVPICLWHSAVAEGRRFQEASALRSGEIRVVVGARSSVFAPLKDLGLVIVDEEHDPTYKQEDRVKYHARDLAVFRSKLSKAVLVLGSATPSLESLENARSGRYTLHRLERRHGTGGTPEVRLVDLRLEEKIENIQAPLAKTTLHEIRETIARGEQVMIFLNRRGFASHLSCEGCGHTPECPHCSVSLTFHKSKRRLRCHQCGFHRRVPETCDKCSSPHLIPVGSGTESLELELPRLLPEVRMLRLDRDQVTSTGRLEAILEEFRSGEASVLMGTQMLAKGHDFPGVTLVVVILADAILKFPDFRAHERALQILLQVSGRAGRREKQGRVLIQTYDTEHPVLGVLQNVMTQDQFLEQESQVRKDLGYPPFGKMALLRVQHSKSGESEKWLESLRTQIEDSFVNIRALGPTPPLIERVQGLYRMDLLLKAKEMKPLHQAVEFSRLAALRDGVSLLVDIDPHTLGSG